MKSRILASALCLALSSSLALAHGDAHQEKQAFDPTTVEQMEFGKAGDPKKVSRTIKFEMTDDMRFHSSNIAVKQGETIRFVARNSGKVKHEMVLGTIKDLKDHYEVMKKNPEMEHAEANMVTVAPGKSGEIIWQFTKAGKVDFGCLQPGHFDAGMKGLVNVAAK